MLLVHVSPAANYEDYREEALAAGQDPSGQVPPGFTLDGGMHHTALGLMRHRANEERLIEVGYAACLMEALVNTPSAILRTDLIRRVYQEAKSVNAALGLAWSGRGGHFMLPMNEDARMPDAFARRVAPIDDLQVFFNTLKDIARERHLALKKGYVFYYPRHSAF